MKSIIFLRHAKSDWSNPSVSDFDRPLNKRGLNDAPRMGRVLDQFGCMADLIISSPSMRTRQTVELTAIDNGYRGEILWDDTLYGGSFYDIMTALHSIPGKISCPMIVGHNPGVEETISLLLSPREKDPTTYSHVRVPTAGLVNLDAHIDIWNDLKPGVCILRWFLIPRLVKAMIK
jgi:phosphohistidine phosphatase